MAETSMGLSHTLKKELRKCAAHESKKLHLEGIMDYPDILSRLVEDYKKREGIK